MDSFRERVAAHRAALKARGGQPQHALSWEAQTQPVGDAKDWLWFCESHVATMGMNVATALAGLAGDKRKVTTTWRGLADRVQVGDHNGTNSYVQTGVKHLTAAGLVLAVANGRGRAGSTTFHLLFPDCAQVGCRHGVNGWVSRRAHPAILIGHEIQVDDRAPREFKYPKTQKDHSQMLGSPAWATRIRQRGCIERLTTSTR